MPTSKSKTKPKKLRPYRVDYFIWEEMLKDKALVRSVIVRAVTADIAKCTIGDSRISRANPGDNFSIIRAYRFYKKLTAEPIRKTYIAIDKLLPAKKAIEVMTEIENRKFPIVLRPEDLPYTDPNHVCTEKCYSFQVIEDSVSEVAEKLRQMSVKEVQKLPDLPASNVANTSGEYTADSIEVLKGMDKPRSGYWITELDVAAPIVNPPVEEPLVETMLPRLVLKEGFTRESELVLNVPKKKRTFFTDPFTYVVLLPAAALMVYGLIRHFVK